MSAQGGLGSFSQKVHPQNTPCMCLCVGKDFMLTAHAIGSVSSFKRAAG